MFQHYQHTEPFEAHGYEALRRLSLELSIKSRRELMQFKEKFMSLTVGKGRRVMDIVRHVETQASQYAQVLSGFQDQPLQGTRVCRYRMQTRSW